MIWKAIAIDDESSCLKSLQAHCSKIDRLEFTKGYDNSVKFINNIEKHQDCNLFFVDLDMPDYDGEFVIDKIRQTNKKAAIVIISGAAKHATTGTKHNCLTLSKPVILNEIEMILSKLEKSIVTKAITLKNLHIDGRTMTIAVEPGDILAISTTKLDRNKQEGKNNLFIYLKRFNTASELKNTSLDRFFKESLHENTHQFFKVNKTLIIGKNLKTLSLIGHNELEISLPDYEIRRPQSVTDIDMLKSWIGIE